MSDIAIRVEHLSKQYRLGQQAAPYETFREALIATASAPIRWLRGERQEKNTFWALDDVSFDIKHGEAVGIIGRNGAGKSTLLKILSSITAPTRGRVELFGRVGSLLEVGTGFHPELTGRENIFLNGAILGMSRAEITRKFDEIVDFAEVEQFLDTPVKFYSSGMYVRLAFAVAAHLEPEILVVDEVLAVGDIQFQKKCLGKMDDVAHQGRTVLFVSHNLGSIAQLCLQSIWLHHGKIMSIGNTQEILTKYVDSLDSSSGYPDISFSEDPKKEVQLRRARLLNTNESVKDKYQCDEPIIIDLEILVRKTVPALYGYLEVCRLDGTKVMVSDSCDITPNHMDNLKTGDHTIQITIPPRTLAAGQYSIYLNFSSIAGQKFNVDSPGTILRFSLDDMTSQRGNSRAGFFSALLEWKVTPSQKNE